MSLTDRLVPLATLLAVIGVPPAAAAEVVNAGALEQLYFANQFGPLLERARALSVAEPGAGYGYMARAYFKQGRWADARAALAKAGVHDREGLLANADFHLFIGEPAAAVTLYMKALAIDPRHSHPALGLALGYLDLEAYDKAYDVAAGAEARAAREGAMQHSRMLVPLGGAMGLKANHGNLIEKLRFGPRVRVTLENALALAPANPSARYALGRFCLEAPRAIGGDPQRAVGLLERAVAIDPYFFRPNAWLIRAQLATHQPGHARDLLVAYRTKFAALPMALREVADLK